MSISSVEDHVAKSQLTQSPSTKSHDAALLDIPVFRASSRPSRAVPFYRGLLPQVTEGYFREALVRQAVCTYFTVVLEASLNLSLVEPSGTSLH